MSEDIQATITAVIGKAPDWIRRDLQSRDAPERIAAEEALAAMIAAALVQGTQTGDQRPAA
jgi:hypothetical protein